MEVNSKLKIRRKAHLGEHHMVRRVNLNGEAGVWCRKCSEYARWKP